MPAYAAKSLAGPDVSLLSRLGLTADGETRSVDDFLGDFMHVLMLSPDAQMIDRRILQEARTLVQAGHQVELLSGFECAQPDAYEEHGYRVKRYRYDWQDRRRMKLRERVGARTARIAWPAVRLATRLADGPTAFEAFVLEKALEHRFDLVHVHDFPMLRCGILAAKARGVPVVYDSHEFYPVQSTFAPEDQKRYLALERRLVRDCAKVITVNPYLARMIGEAHDIAPPVVILNACDRPLFVASELQADERRERRVAAGLPPDDIIFLYQGWLSAERNLEPMVQAMGRQKPGVSLAVVGYGVYEEALRRQAIEAGAGDRVFFLGRIENEILSSVTALCDVGIVPYRAVDEMHRFCSPNKLFEFVAAGIPILASDLPYLRDIVAGFEIGWLEQLEEVGVFATRIAAIAADPQAIAAKRNALAKAFAALNWTVEGEKLLGIYRDVVSQMQTQSV